MFLFSFFVYLFNIYEQNAIKNNLTKKNNNKLKFIKFNCVMIKLKVYLLMRKKIVNFELYFLLLN